MAKKPFGFNVGNVNYGRFSGVNPGRAANENKTVRQRISDTKKLTAESNRMLKEASRDFKINSGKYAYGPKTPAAPSAASRVAGAVGRVIARAAGPVGALVGMNTPAGTVGRVAARAAGPVGALVGMTTPAGAPEESASIEREKSYGPLMRGGMKPGYTYKGGVSVPTRGMSGPPKSAPSKPTTSRPSTPRSGGPSNNLSAPSRTQPSRSSAPTKSTGPSRGPTSAPVRTAPSKPAAKSTGPSRGPTSAPSRTAPSRANLGTSRFAKGGSVKKRRK